MLLFLLSNNDPQNNVTTQFLSHSSLDPKLQQKPNNNYNNQYKQIVHDILSFRIRCSPWLLPHN